MVQCIVAYTSERRLKLVLIFLSFGTASYCSSVVSVVLSLFSWHNELKVPSTSSCARALFSLWDRCILPRVNRPEVEQISHGQQIQNFSTDTNFGAMHWPDRSAYSFCCYWKNWGDHHLYSWFLYQSSQSPDISSDCTLTSIYYFVDARLNSK